MHKDKTERPMRDRRPKNFPRTCKRFVHGSFGDFCPRDATELAIKQNNAHNFLMKRFHVEVGFIDCLGVVQRSR